MVHEQAKPTGRIVPGSESLFLKDSLRHLMRTAYSKCDERLSRVQFDAEILSAAFDALRFGVRYAPIETAYRFWYAGYYREEVTNRQIVFHTDQRAKGDRSAVRLLHKNWEQLQYLRTLDLERLQLLNPDHLNPLVQGSIIERAPTLRFSPVPALQEIGSLAADLQIHPPGVFDEATNGRYSLFEARIAWRYFVGSLFIHETCCRFTRSTSSAVSWIPAIVQVVKKTDLTEQLSRLGLSAQIAHAIIEDMIFPGNDKKADIRVHPIVQDGDLLYLTPGLFATADWETLVLRLWSRKYSGEYGAKVASKKKKLARDFADLFSERFEVSVDRVISDEKKRQLGDVDVAVFSATDKFLALFEAKWLLPPDEAEEVMQSDAEAEKGVQQVQRAVEFAKEHPQEFFSQVLPQITQIPSEFKTIGFLVCQGHIPSQEVTGEIRIIDFELSKAYFGQNMSLPAICEHLTGLLERPSEMQDYNWTTDSFRVAGFDFSLPALAGPGYRGRTEEHPSKVGRNEKCSCGSGRKFKRCCG